MTAHNHATIFGEKKTSPRQQPVRAPSVDPMSPHQMQLDAFFAQAPPSSLSQQLCDDALDTPAGTKPHAERLLKEEEEEEDDGDDDDHDGDAGDGDAPASAGAVGAQQTPDAVHTALKRNREETAEEIVSCAFLADGQFEITTNRRTLIISKDTAEYLHSINKLRNLKINCQGYIHSNQTPLHRLVGDKFCMTDEQVRAQYPEHFKAHPHDRIVVMHLDNDKLNFNSENLERGPQMLNLYMQMCQPRKMGNGYAGKVTVNKKQEVTKIVKTVQEAKHATDILKMQKMLPEFRSFIFKHAMHRPVEFAEHYASIETLLARAPMYAKRVQKPQKPRESKNMYQAFRTLDAARNALTAEQWKLIDSILATPHVVPFDDDLDAVILYTGAHGKQIVLLMEYLFYTEHLEKTKPMMGTNSNGYIQINLADGLNLLHNIILDRHLHQSANDGLQGGHGWGKTLDNRKRVLSPQTVNENNSQRGRADVKSVPGVVGVTKWKNGRFQAQIGSFFKRGDIVHLGYFETVEEASAAYQFALANKARLVEMCKDLENPKAELRARCLAKCL